MIPKAFFEYKALVEAAAARHNYDPALLAAQAHQESAWKPNAVSHCGAQGLMQFMPGTWKQMGKGDPFNPADSLAAGVRYMVALLNQLGDVRLALAAYNWGIGNLTKAMNKAKSKDWDKVSEFAPKETRDYVPKILGRVPLYRTVLGIVKNAIPAGLVVLVAVLGVLAVRRIA